MYELISECKTDELLTAAFTCVTFLWDKRVPLRERNLLLSSLITSIRSREHWGWCGAVLRLGCYPILASIQTLTEAPWEEVLSSFDDVIDNPGLFDLHADSKNARRRISTLTIDNTRSERSADNRNATLTKQLGEHSHIPLDALLSGEAADPLAEVTRDEAKKLLDFLAKDPGAGFNATDIEPILDKHFGPARPRTDAERQRTHRAKKRIGGVTKSDPSSLVNKKGK